MRMTLVPVAAMKAADGEDLVPVPVAEAIWGYEQHHKLGGAWRAAA